MRIELYTDDRAKDVADLYHSAVHAIDSSIYSESQKQAWAPTPPDYLAWRNRMATKQAFLALVRERVAGFIELDPDGHIDCTYTHPVYQGRGIATSLFQHVERLALSRGLSRLFVEASIVAQPFFARQGFIVLHENKARRNGELLLNYSMEKYLIAGR